jgi:BirA family transcriptional regulator, biotin operon repressor / biotin---[acetyl-CoA-carboxylase] ligase
VRTPSASRPFDPRRFAALRLERALPWGAPLVYRAETGSTNDDALAAARAGAESGSVFLAEHQSAGRGRRGRSWAAAAGESLLFSVLLRPESSAAPISALSLAVGLGVRAALQPFSRERLLVKWPNDVLAGSRKIAGVLCEGIMSQSRVDALVIGVGVNIGRQPFPPELARTAVALAELGPPGPVQADVAAPASPLAGAAPGMEPELLLVELLAGIQVRVAACLSAGLGAILNEFPAHDALRDTQVHVTGPTSFTGTARGVDAEGRLLVESDGMLIAVFSGTVRAAS